MSRGLLKDIVIQHLVAFGYERCFPGMNGDVNIVDVEFEIPKKGDINILIKYKVLEPEVTKVLSNGKSP